MESVKISKNLTSKAQLDKLFAQYGAGLSNALPQLYKAVEDGTFVAKLVALETKDATRLYLAVTNPLTGRSEVIRSGIYYELLTSDKSPLVLNETYKATLTFKELIPGVTPELVETAYGSTNPAAVKNFKLAHAKKEFSFIELLELEF